MYETLLAVPMVPVIVEVFHTFLSPTLYRSTSLSIQQPRQSKDCLDQRTTGKPLNYVLKHLLEAVQFLGTPGHMLQ